MKNPDREFYQTDESKHDLTDLRTIYKSADAFVRLQSFINVLIREQESEQAQQLLFAEGAEGIYSPDSPLWEQSSYEEVCGSAYEQQLPISNLIWFVAMPLNTRD